MSVSQEQAIQTERIGGRDRTDFWSDRRYDDLECLHATFVDHAFKPHFHDTYSFGTICRGVEIYRVDGTPNVAVPGDSIMLNPGVVHDGRPGEIGFEYRMLYPSQELMTGIAEEVFDRPVSGLEFKTVSSADSRLHRETVQLHRALRDDPESLGKDGMIVRTLGLLIERHADTPWRPRRVGDEKTGLAKARAWLEEHLPDDTGMDVLARIACLSRFHFIRAFRKEYGVTPHVYRTSRRIARARKLLKRGISLAETALDCGFVDQSHMTRVFKNVVGVTPGQYRRSVMYS